MGQKSNGLRSDSSRWLEPCMTQFIHWQCLSPNIWPISWVMVCKQIVYIYWQWWQSWKHQQSAPRFQSTKADRVLIFFNDLAGSKQQSAGDGWSVVSFKHRVGSRFGLKLLLQPPSITSGVEVVIIPGKAEDSHSCKHTWNIQEGTAFKLVFWLCLAPPSGHFVISHHNKQHELIKVY